MSKIGGIKVGMGNTVSEAPEAAQVEENNKPSKAKGFYSIHAGRCCGKPWPMNEPFVPETDEEKAFCKSLVERGYATEVK